MISHQQCKIFLLNSWTLGFSGKVKGFRSLKVKWKPSVIMEISTWEKMTSAQSFLLRTNEHIQRAPESVGHGRHWLICVIKKEGDLWIILLFSNMFPRLTVSLKKGFCFNQIYMLVVWLSQDTWGKFKCTTYIKSRLWPSQKSALKGEIAIKISTERVHRF